MQGGSHGIAHPPASDFGSGDRLAGVFQPGPLPGRPDPDFGACRAPGIKALILPYEATANGAGQSIPDAEL